MGHAGGEHAREAGREAARIARDSLAKKNLSAHFYFVFASSLFDQQELLSGVTEIFPGLPMGGASTAGEIAHSGPLAQHSVVVVACHAPETHVSFANEAHLAKDAAGAGARAAQSALAPLSGTRADLLFMFADGLTANGSSVLRGIQRAAGTDTPIVGGSAGDDGAYQKTMQYCNGTVHSDSVTVGALAGGFSFSVGVRHGWMPVGLSKTITKSEGNILHEIDGKPAIELYKDYLGDDIEDLLVNKTLAEVALPYPLGLTLPGSDELLLRAPFYVDEKGSITCGGEVPEGAQVRLMLGSKEEAIAAARRAARAARENLAGTPKLILIFNCHVRDKLYAHGDHARREIQAVHEVFGEEVPLAGFYTYAEQAPVAGISSAHMEGGCTSELHNETIVIVALAD